MSPAIHSPLTVEVTGFLAFSVFAEAADRNPPFHSFMSHISICESLNSPKKVHIPLDFLKKRPIIPLDFFGKQAIIPLDFLRK
ncbi:MAG: hypothetical protein HDR87_00485 [Bacteroides sp.]|nr:hypothetical protein [Bacteroides sp.]